ncbi:MAG: bacteriohemerythrin [Terracidiphilus sp.]|jgi:hemerythrin-like metal-binding protein
MPLVVWSDKLSVGIKNIDEQHTVLFDTINELHAAMIKGQARTIVGELLARLLTYTRNHFSDEERMLESSGYPDLPQHRVLHRNLTKQVEDYIARFQSGDLTLSTDLAGFLSDWLKKHIQGTDQLYGPYMNQRGVR